MEVNNLARKIGRTLIEAGLKMIASAFHIQPQQITYQEMSGLIASKLAKYPAGQNPNSGLMDGNYFLIDIATWKEIIATDWTENKQYLVDKWDCDNFAYTFAAHVSEIFDISVSTCYGEVYNKDTGKFLNWHYWNTIMTYEADGKHLYFFEPQTGEIVEIVGQQDIILGNWKYVPHRVIVF